MPVPRRLRLLLGGGGLVAATTLGLGALLAPQAASAPRTPAVPAVRGAADRSATRTSAVAAPSALRAAVAKPRLRLTLTIRRGRTTLAVVGVLRRLSTGELVANRSIAVYQRTADTGRWLRVRTLRTSAGGRIEYDLRDRPRLQFTLRFAGDSRFAAAASQTIVPEPTASGLSPKLVTALAGARAAARRAGLTLVVNSGYRSWALQQQWYDAAVRRYGSDRLARRWVLPPGESTHVRGLAVDLGTPATATWLVTHGARYGLCRAYRSEPWHFEYRPDWVAAFGGRCPAPVATPGDPDPLSPAPRVPVL
ncbi:MAG: D-alanyl-D-alanine carboxypeptidase family protein [Kineosporiaceae bacterium]